MHWRTIAATSSFWFQWKSLWKGMIFCCGLLTEHWFVCNMRTHQDNSKKTRVYRSATATAVISNQADCSITVLYCVWKWRKNNLKVILSFGLRFTWHRELFLLLIWECIKIWKCQFSILCNLCRMSGDAAYNCVLLRGPLFQEVQFF